jgi:hypothetical protein
MSNSINARSRKFFVVALLVLACSRESARREPVTDPRAGDTAAHPSTQPALASGPYIGTRHNPLPAGVSFKGGTTFRLGSAEYALSHVATPEGEMIWLDSIVSTSNHEPTMLVRASLRVPPLARDEQLLMGSCDANGHLDERVVAIAVKNPEDRRTTTIRQAWRADARRERFDVIPVTGVSCDDPGAA